MYYVLAINILFWLPGVVLLLKPFPLDQVQSLALLLFGIKNVLNLKPKFFKLIILR